VCVLSTLKDAIERGYDILLVEDCCAAAEQDLHDAVVKSVQMEGGIAGAVAKVDEVIRAIESWSDVETKV
jgi:nicotinamidase-related amidase